jgi:activator of HSP90 ATPase
MRTTPVRSLRQRVLMRAKAAAVYGSLVRAREHATFTGAAAQMRAVAGGRFRLYDGSFEGTVVDLVPNQSVVRAWRTTGWPKGHFSIARLELAPVGGGTRIDLSQYGIPASDFRDISEGWKTYY